MNRKYFPLCGYNSGTGEGDVEDAEKLLQPYLKQYPKVWTQNVYTDNVNMLYIKT